MKVGDNFNPEVGFVRRDNMRRSYGLAKFAPRPKVRFKGIRQFTYQGTVEYIENGAGQLETRIQTARFAAERQNSDLFSVEADADYELLLRPFAVSPGRGHPSRRLLLQPGDHVVRDGAAAASLGYVDAAGRPVLRRNADGDRLYRGACVDAQAMVGRTKRFVQRRQTAGRRFHDHGGSRRARITVFRRGCSRPRCCNTARPITCSAATSAIRWEYLPGSELFVVYTDERDTLQPGLPGSEEPRVRSEGESSLQVLGRV